MFIQVVDYHSLADYPTGERENGRTGGREDGRAGAREHGSAGAREDGRTGGREDGRTGGREDEQTERVWIWKQCNVKYLLVKKNVK